MPSYKQLIPLIREGWSPKEIMAHFSIEPWRLKRMFSSKRLWRELGLEGEMSLKLAEQKVAAGVSDIADRLIMLACDDKVETARKACVELLAEGEKISREREQKDTPPKPLPWEL